MILSFETLLCLGAGAFYLYDSCELLHVNELVLEQRGEGWRYVSATSGLRLLRKSLFVPNPLRPDRTLYLLAWFPGRPPCNANLEQLHLFEAQLLWLRRFVCLLLLMLLVLPLVLAVFGSGKMLLALFGFYYLTVIVGLLLVCYKRRALGLGGSPLALLAAECLLCPPLAINLLRRITRRNKFLPQEPLGFASRTLEPKDRLKLVTDVCGQVERQLEWLEPGSNRYAGLVDFCEQVQGLARSNQVPDAPKGA